MKRKRISDPGADTALRMQRGEADFLIGILRRAEEAGKLMPREEARLAELRAALAGFSPGTTARAEIEAEDQS